MADIRNLIPDMEAVLADGKDSIDNKLLAAHLGDIGKSMRKQVSKDTRGPRPAKTLFASELGKPCKRELWMKINRPELAGKLNGTARFKFMYGDMVEGMALWLAREAGHDVQYQQEPVEVHLDEGWVVRGRIDAVIDGVLVDVKSAAPTAMSKFKQGLNDKNDAFGYRSQLGVYLDGVTAAGKTAFNYAAFLAIDKSSGEMVLLGCDSSTLKYDMPGHVLNALEDNTNCVFPRIEAVAHTVPMPCRYCAFVASCWPKAKPGTTSTGKPTLLTGE